jgi:urease accessory protein
MDWRLWQMLDSAFPTGGFAHSGGLEAAKYYSGVEVEAFACAALWQAGTFALPFVRESYRAPERASELERLCDASQASHVVRRASQLQGRALARACVDAFDLEPVAAAHLPVVLGAMSRRLDIAEREVLALFLFFAGRGVISAALRLCLLGPSQAQRVLARLPFDRVLAQCAARSLSQASHSAPVIELLGSLHDQLPARLFQS